MLQKNSTNLYKIVCTSECLVKFFSASGQLHKCDIDSDWANNSFSSKELHDIGPYAIIKPQLS